MKIARTSTTPPETRRGRNAGEAAPLVGLPSDAFDDRIAIVGTVGSGKTYAAKGFVERLLESGAWVAVVDPLGVWWGLRASADGSAPGYPVIVFGGKHADVPITSDMGVPLGASSPGKRSSASSICPISAATLPAAFYGSLC